MVKKQEARKLLDLGGEWKYRVDGEEKGIDQEFWRKEYDTSDWKGMKIPNNWYLTEIGDYHGVVWFKKTFKLPEDMVNKQIVLRFSAVDYIAHVWLNNCYLGSHEGYFAPFEFDITGKTALEGENVLIVRVNSPLDPTEYVLVKNPDNLSSPLSEPYKIHWPKALTTIKGHHIHGVYKLGSHTRFGQAGNSGGIWQDVCLIATDKIKIRKTKVYCKIVEKDGSAIISIDVQCENSTDEVLDTQVNLKIKPANFDSGETYEKNNKIQLKPGLNDLKIIKTIEEPRLWWTWDHGEPNLYEAEITIGEEQSDQIVEYFGIKEFIRTEDCTCYLNGRRIFLRGVRYFSSQWISEMKGRYESELRKMIEQGINTIRIGSHVELPEFYDLCDELGLMVWQVFPMHFAYSDSDELIEKAVPMMKDLVSMLYNHVCIAMWSVFKEPDIYALQDPPNNRGRLCQIMYEAARSVDPIRWVHYGDYKEGVLNITIGQVFPGDTDVKKINLEPWIIETGTGAAPCKETLEACINEKDLWPPNWDIWEYHCLAYNWFFNNGKVELGSSLDEFIENSQVYQARAIKEQIEFFRQKKYYPIRAVFQYMWNDPYPGFSTAMLDYYRRPLKSYEIFRHVYTPVLVSLEWNRTPYVLGRSKIYNPGESFAGKVWVTSDLWEDLNDAVMTWKVTNLSTEEVVLNNRYDISIPADCSKIVDEIVWEIPENQAKAEFRVDMRIEDSSGNIVSENFFDFSAYAHN